MEQKVFIQGNKTVSNLQSMKSPMELNSLFQNSFVVLTGLLNYLVKCDTGRLANETFTSNLIASSKQ